jgi:hypothetical protein
VTPPKLAKVEISSERRLRTLWLPARLLPVSAVAKRMNWSSRLCDACEASRRSRMKRGSESSSGLKGRASQLKKPHITWVSHVPSPPVRSAKGNALLSSGRRCMSKFGSARMPGALDTTCGSPCGMTAMSPSSSLTGSNPASHERYPAQAAGDDMILDRMPGAGRHLVGNLRCRWRFRNSWRFGGDVEKDRPG